MPHLLTVHAMCTVRQYYSTGNTYQQCDARKSQRSARTRERKSRKGGRAPRGGDAVRGGDTGPLTPQGESGCSWLLSTHLDASRAAASSAAREICIFFKTSHKTFTHARVLKVLLTGYFFKFNSARVLLHFQPYNTVPYSLFKLLHIAPRF